MFGRGFQCEALELKRSSLVRSWYVFTLGLIVTHNTMFSHVRAIAVSCSSGTISVKYQHCGIHEDTYGIHDLDCFGKHNSPGIMTCVWKPGSDASEKTYTLIVQQPSRKYCRAHTNITGLSEDIKVYEKHNLTVEVSEDSDTTKCTRAVFRGSPKSLLRCGPPHRVTFSRHAGRLALSVSWQQADVRAVENYSVRYQAMGSLEWSRSPVRSQSAERCTVEHLNASLVYTVQIRCARNTKCSQCVWSEAYAVPPELTTPPDIVDLHDTDIADRKGRRLITLAWTFPAKELPDGYHVSVCKASGEAPCKPKVTTQPEVRLILSHSAYQLTISAFNNASTSPVVSREIPRRGAEHGAGDKLNVTVHSETSFTIYWKDDLVTKHVCYSAEWVRRGHRAAHMSFYQRTLNHRTLSPLPEPLEPYQRYSIALHTRPDKQTCNMKRVNNSESTYGTAQFYLRQGPPGSAPANVTTHNVTLKSVVLRWSSIPEDDARGFLLGYIIHYAEHQHKGAETNISVDPAVNSYKLEDLKSGTIYQVQLSGFTQAGAGVRSKTRLFTTNPYQGYSNLTAIITVSAVLVALLIIGSQIIKRLKVMLWPSVPHPGNSKAMHRLEGSCELELLRAIRTLEVGQWDADSLQVVEKEDVVPAGALASMLLASEDDGEMVCNRVRRDTGDDPGRDPPYVSAETFWDVPRADTRAPSPASRGGYTTMEMFGKVRPLEANTPDAVLKSGSDYVRRSSTSPTSDDEDEDSLRAAWIGILQSMESQECGIPVGMFESREF